MRSFIGWIGGKSHLKNQIISLIPSDCNRYIEVCGGAGWVLFGKDKIKGQMEIFNDIDGDLINLEHLDRICEVLGCDVADILEYQPNKIKKTGTNLILEQNGNRKKNN